MAMQSSIDYINQLQLAEPAGEDIAIFRESIKRLTNPIFGKIRKYGFSWYFLTLSKNGLTDELSSDIANSALLAQMVANGRVNRNKNIYKWYKIYIKTLSKVGWAIKKQDLQRPKGPQTLQRGDYNWREFLDKILATFYNDEERKKILKVTLPVMQTNPSTSLFAMNITDTNSTIHINSNFNLSSSISKNEANLKASCLKFTTSRPIISLRFAVNMTKLDEDSVFAGHEMTLNTSEYDKIRKTLNKKIAEHIKKLIASFDL